MTTFNLPKKAEDVEGGVNVPEDWYTLEILEEPVKEANKKAQSGLSEAEGGGENIILHLRLNHEDPIYDGRRFRIWLPYPNEYDKTAYGIGGQTKEDSKMELIRDVYAVFAGIDSDEVSGDEIDFSIGDRAEFYVTQSLDQQGVKVINEVSVFKQLPRPVSR